MSLFQLASQVYNIFDTVPIYRRMKRKARNHFETLQQMRTMFVEADFHDGSLEQLTSLVYAYNRKVEDMHVYGHEKEKRDSVVSSLRCLERKIVNAYAICNDALSRHYRSISYRHSV